MKSFDCRHQILYSLLRLCIGPFLILIGYFYYRLFYSALLAIFPEMLSLRRKACLVERHICL